MPGTLVYIEHHDGEPTNGSLGVLSTAAGLGGDVAAVVVGAGARDAASGLGAFGASKVYVAEGEALAKPLPQPRVDVLAKLVPEGGFDNVLFASSVLTADVAAGLSARLDAGLNWDLTGIEASGDGVVGKRPALGDTVLVDAGWVSSPRLALFRTGAFEPSAQNGGQPEVEDVTAEVEEWSTKTRMIEQAHEEKSGPSIEDADIVVAGGRGLGEAEKFSLLEDLANALGGAVAATRAVVDAGWYPYAAQVGQTGRVVSPKLYVACGISGAIQHKVGMQGAGTIVAINKDPNAPIFEYSDLAIVGDLHEIVPKLTELVRGSKTA